MAQHVFTVEEIHCDACERAIRKSLLRMDGVRSVEPQAATNEVRVGYDDATTDVAALADRLADAGYPVVR